MTASAAATFQLPVTSPCQRSEPDSTVSLPRRTTGASPWVMRQGSQLPSRCGKAMQLLYVKEQLFAALVMINFKLIRGPKR